MQTRSEIDNTPNKEQYLFFSIHADSKQLVETFLNEYANETGLTIKRIKETEVNVSRIWWFATKKQKEIEYERDLEIFGEGVFNDTTDENGNIIPKQKDLHKIIETSRNRHLAFQDIEKQEEDIFGNITENFR